MANTKKVTNKVARSTTPPAIKTVGVREFMRGGIYDITEPTVVMSHSDELGTWYPRGQGMTANYMASSTPTLNMSPAAAAMAGSASFTGVIESAVEAAVRRATEHLQSPTTSTTTKGEGNTNG